MSNQPSFFNEKNQLKEVSHVICQICNRTLGDHKTWEILDCATNEIKEVKKIE